MDTAASGRPLPDPDRSPGTDVVLWDGQCNFCRQQVMRLRSFDWTGRLSFLDLHDPRVAERYPELSYDQLMDEMWVVTPQGNRYGGADALRYLSRALPVLWPAAPLLHVPFSRPFWRWAYHFVAQRRYRLAGRNCEGGTCHLHARPK